jgi:hypothetical protein
MQDAVFYGLSDLVRVVRELDLEDEATLAGDASSSITIEESASNVSEKHPLAAAAATGVATLTAESATASNLEHINSKHIEQGM